MSWSLKFGIKVLLILKNVSKVSDKIIPCGGETEYKINRSDDFFFAIALLVG